MKPHVTAVVLALVVCTISNPSHSAESKTPTPSAAQIELVRQYARQRGGQPEALAQLVQLSRGVDDATTAAMIAELSAAHLRAGNLDLAAAARRAILEKYPSEPIARDSVLWLIHLYASGEVAHAHREPSPAEKNLKHQLSPKMAAALKEVAAEAEGEQTSAPQKPPDERALYAMQLGSQAVAANRALAEDPAIAFARAIAARRAGQDKAAAALLSPLKRRAPGDLWGDCARAEAWLADMHHNQPTKKIIHCIAAAEPPHLDGQLNDACWQQENPTDAAAIQPTDQISRVALATGSSPPSNEQPARILWAYDDQYLYLAVECKKLAGVDYSTDDRPRPHDGDVETHDRVEVSLDLDRDYATAFELAIDSRGWTADRGWSDPAWNPEWFVAVAQGETHWTAEAAIPWSELTTTPPHSGEAWACAIKRSLPQTPASSAPKPESFAILIAD